MSEARDSRVASLLDELLLASGGRFYALTRKQVEAAFIADHEALTRQIETLTAERDKAIERAKRAWAAATDETLVGWHRDMALRFSEDRDIQKHRARNAEARAGQAEHRATALEAKIKYLADGWCIPSTAYYVGTGSIEHLSAWQGALKWCAGELRALLTAVAERQAAVEE